MTSIAGAMLVVFVCAWFGALAFWFYGASGFMPWWWARIRGRKAPTDIRRGRKILIGFGGFMLMFAVGFGAGAIAEFWGAGWDQTS